jgi:hypothetical protein
MQKASAEAKRQWRAQDTRKRVTAAVMVTACRIVAPPCEDEAVRHTHVPRGRMAPEHVIRLLHDVAAACDIVGLAITEYMPWKEIATRKLLRRLPLLGGKCDLTKKRTVSCLLRTAG